MPTHSGTVQTQADTPHDVRGYRLSNYAHIRSSPSDQRRNSIIIKYEKLDYVLTVFTLSSKVKIVFFSVYQKPIEHRTMKPTTLVNPVRKLAKINYYVF